MVIKQTTKLSRKLVWHFHHTLHFPAFVSFFAVRSVSTNDV